MGYYTTVSGELTLSPHLTREQLKTLASTAPVYGSDLSSWGLSIDYHAKFYTLEQEIIDFVEAAGALSVSVHGSFVCVGEEQPDIWRLAVKDGTVTNERAKIVWPDGEEYHA